MNAWPHGVMVVPTVPTTASQYAGDTARCGMTRFSAAAPQSGLARKADRMYAAEMTAPTAMNRYWTLLKLPLEMSSTITMAAATALIGRGTPNSSRAAPMPAYSASVVPKLATSMVTATKAAHRTPKRSRTSPVRPCPVARPSRAPTSWVKKRTIWLARITHRSA